MKILVSLGVLLVRCPWPRIGENRNGNGHLIWLRRFNASVKRWVRRSGATLRRTLGSKLKFLSFIWIPLFFVINFCPIEVNGQNIQILHSDSVASLGVDSGEIFLLYDYEYRYENFAYVLRDTNDIVNRWMAFHYNGVTSGTKDTLFMSYENFLLLMEIHNSQQNFQLSVDSTGDEKGNHTILFTLSSRGNSKLVLGRFRGSYVIYDLPSRLLNSSYLFSQNFKMRLNSNERVVVFIPKN